eukprot:TRINITY_DN7229_c0_g1_i1.p1 TRINITY_DN7229_c0_g1~~TRINITY_DN7229_c0_g1_i1.p1  ORF type:complete len:225 (+),score=37.44 TRINITY_DN7229_c0_g1_i1:290-964(+)
MPEWHTHSCTHLARCGSFPPDKGAGVNYPAEVPAIYVVPGQHMKLIISPTLQQDGRCYPPFLAQWNAQQTLLGLLQQLVAMFDLSSPVQVTLLEDLAVAAGKGLMKAAAATIRTVKAAAQEVARQQQMQRETAQRTSPLHAPPAPTAPRPAAPPQAVPVQDDPKKDTDVPATEPGTECVICLENKKCCFCLPCGHVATCMGCGKGLKECCICRAPIQQQFKAYL